MNRTYRLLVCVLLAGCTGPGGVGGGPTRLNSERRTSALRAALPSGPTISGHVYDSNGQPIAGVNIVVTPMSAGDVMDNDSDGDVDLDDYARISRVGLRGFALMQNAWTGAR